MVPAYTEAWKQRIEGEQRALQRETARARRAAARAAQVLVETFGASEVWLFGSLVEGVRHEGFDVDLAVGGVAPERWFEALDRVCEATGRSVDMVPLESCSTSLRRRVAERGRRLA